MTTKTKEKTRVILIPVNGRARVEYVPGEVEAGRKAMERLIFSDCFDHVTVQQHRDGSGLMLLVDDDGIRRGLVPHFWARGAILYGPLLLVAYDGEGATVSIEESLCGLLLAHLHGVPGAHRTWKQGALFAPIPPGELDEAFTASEEAYVTSVKHLRQQAGLEGAFVVETERPKAPKK